MKISALMIQIFNFKLNRHYISFLLNFQNHINNYVLIRFTWVNVFLYQRIK